jgi:seryl-tRNA(Sec) selenium transferase
MGIYERLGVRTHINAAGNGTANGGSLMDARVFEAMQEAGRSFVRLPDLHEKAGKRVAELAGVETAYFTSGAAAGVTVVVAAWLAGQQGASPAATRPGIAGAVPRDGRHNPLDGTTPEHERMTYG